jgi:hypothetical protein
MANEFLDPLIALFRASVDSVETRYINVGGIRDIFKARHLYYGAV